MVCGCYFLLSFQSSSCSGLIELFVAKRNEKWMLGQGAFEAGAAHYPIMVTMHIAFFVSFLLEVVRSWRVLSPFWILLLGIFLLTQMARIWCLTSLGKFWNTKIIILPGADVVRKVLIDGYGIRII